MQLPVQQEKQQNPHDGFLLDKKIDVLDTFELSAKCSIILLLVIVLS